MLGAVRVKAAWLAPSTPRASDSRQAEKQRRNLAKSTVRISRAVKKSGSYENVVGSSSFDRFT